MDLLGLDCVYKLVLPSQQLSSSLIITSPPQCLSNYFDKLADQVKHENQGSN